MSKMSKIVGITGNIASGKSSVSDYLIEKGYVVIDADQITNTLYNDNKDFKLFIKNTFGDSVIDNGIVNRKKISSLVFNDYKLLDKLSVFSFKIIRDILISKISQLNNEIIFVDAAVLFEANWQDIFDEIILITTSKQLQIERLMNRNHYTKEESLLRINSQIDQGEKIKRCTYVINNESELLSLYKEIESAIKEIVNG